MSMDTLADEMPLRDELFCAEQMEQYAKHLALKHPVGKSRYPDRLLSRLDDNERCLIEMHTLLNEAVKSKLQIVPAAEWLLDNFYLIDEQVRTARRHLPKNYSRELPRLSEGPSSGLPRVYDLAMEVISHGDGRVDNEVLTLFVSAYQTVTPLLLGELWAIPIMLRLAMIENLRRISVRIVADRVHVNLAQSWATKMLEVAENDPKNLILVIADMARSNPPMVSSFVAELERCLQGHGSALSLPLSWIRQRLAESSLSTEQMVLTENQQQAADQVSVSNTIGSLRFLGAMDWREFIESMSLVEQVLCKDSTHVYSLMDFTSRDRYRQTIDSLAKRTPDYTSNLAQTEILVAETVITLAASSAEKNGHQHFTANPGYYLIDKGLPLLEAVLGVKVSIISRIRRGLGHAPLLVYLGSMLILTTVFTSLLLVPVYQQGMQIWPFLLLTILVFMAFSQLASTLVNWLVTLLLRPELLPRMDYSKGVPADKRTLVVIPCLLNNEQGIAGLLDALEVRFLGCRDQHLHFALLSDFCDADSESLPDDKHLLMLVSEGIKGLNLKYQRPDVHELKRQGQLNHEHAEQIAVPDSFFLFHRSRCWNPSENKWMGCERKRGKLGDLNRALRGAGWERFSSLIGNVETLSDVKYIITLDTDTELPRDSAQQFIATMAHPLNQPRYDEHCRRVIGGYGILQPRMAASLSGANRSRYAQLCGNEPGIDPYTRSISDVYQDLFAEGSFIGKGIYDIDAFEYVLNQRFPENRILSHDLLEGCYARSGLLSDVHLYEEYPARYQADIERQQRWVRGDWQIADWIMPAVPGANGKKERNPLSMLSQWKILDNLRRSLIPIVFLLLLIIGWFLLDQPWHWSLVIVSIVIIPCILAALVDGLHKPNEVRYRQHLASVLSRLQQNLILGFFRLSCLPYEAWINLSVILRTSWRVLWTHKHLLEWNVFNNQTSPDSKDGCAVDKGKALVGQDSVVAAYRTMWVTPALGIGVVVAMFEQMLNHSPGFSLFVAVIPVAGLWILAPFFSWWLSKPLIRNAHHLSSEQILFLRRVARKTWVFFEQFVTQKDNWLPPDNFQECPGPILAHRTSPTNIGMALLANVSAADFGYISIGVMLMRTSDTFSTLEKLERFQGHFYNWYDTETLQPLPPRYISSVDSGNLVGHVLTLRAALLEIKTQALLSERVFDGLVDSMYLMLSGMNDADDADDAIDPYIVDQSHRWLADVQAYKPINLYAVVANLDTFLQTAAKLVFAIVNPDHAERVAEYPPCLPEADGYDDLASRSDVPGSDENITQAILWLRRVERQAQEALDDVLMLSPWLRLKDLPDAMQTQMIMLNDGIPSLADLHDHSVRWLSEIDQLLGIEQQMKSDSALPLSTEQCDRLVELRKLIDAGRLNILERLECAEKLARQSDGFTTIEYEFLYDRPRHLLAVGYNVDECRRDTSYYDLLASEARLCNFVGIAQGKLPQESWFALGRLLTKAGGEPVLVSWSGSMFEYLMPLLVMPLYDCSLLEQSCRAAVARQIAYGKQRGMPWGVSESCYNLVDANSNYQYHAFGVPGLGLKRGLAEESVVAPYASALALMIAPELACQNLQQFASLGIEGRYGFYEALDYTPTRLQGDQAHAVVRCFMAHHQGMTLLSLVNLLGQQTMQRRFVSDPALKATLLLLQERVPKITVLDTRIADHSEGEDFSDAADTSIDEPITEQTPNPEVQLLSNGRYQVMISNAGGGYSRWQAFAITRWREDSTCDNWGSFIYLREMMSGRVWSAAHQPTCQQADSYAVVFSEGRAEYRRRDSEIETYTEIVVSPEDDIELRRVRLTNRSQTRKTIELTSYSEVVLASPDADAMQSNFGKLFVQSEIIEAENAILCSRRPRSAGEKPPWMFHLLGTNGTKVNAISFETDRMRFIGRGRTSAAPQAMQYSAALSGTQGSVLDPVVAIRCQVVIEPRQAVTLDFIFGAASSRDVCMALIERYQDRHLADRVIDLAGTHSSVILRQINARQLEARLYRRLASSVIYANATLRADASVLLQNRRGQSGLWGYAISGDLPIVLLKITDLNCLDHARQLIQCHAYWRLKGLAVDLVIWNENHIGYRQQLQDQIMGLISTGSYGQAMDRPGGIFVRFAEQISLEDRILLQAAARVIIVDSVGTLMEQLNRRVLSHSTVARLMPISSPVIDGESLSRRVMSQFSKSSSFSKTSPDPKPAQAPTLILDNPLGGFNHDGTEYIITTSANCRTPAPWVNVIANPDFGTVVSESGLAYSWSENAHEFRLTPWSDDPVGASGGEAFYLRDEISGRFWSPTAQPFTAFTGRAADRPASYRTRHGFGYSIFEHTTADNIHSELSVYVDLEAPVKFSVLKVRNDSGRIRQLSATGFVEWVLGDLRSKNALHVVTRIDPASGALFASNEYNTEFSGRVAFFDVDDMSRTLTGDRTEFLGRNGSLTCPDALTRKHLSGRVGPALDPCGALQVSFTLAVGEERELIFRLGCGRDHVQASTLAKRLRTPGTAIVALAGVQAYWQKTLGAVQIETPDPALNVLANGWLVYQAQVSRLWARSGFYQSGGAYGFRDQLQDAMALVHINPSLLRNQIILCGQRQYPQGDVQHWWHPPSGRGVRTRCSDDYLWLPLALCRYLQHTGDKKVLDEPLCYLEGRALNPDEESYYDLPAHSLHSESLYKHCCQAIKHGLRLGEHGLPLMGSGDWNDGMNLVGIEGKGESVWLGFFLYKVLTSFADVAQAYGDIEFSEFCLKEASNLLGNLADHAWDGKWYKRAWFDDGTPLGSSSNTECTIDSISQSWSVLSGAASSKTPGIDGKERALKAMDSLDQYLVRREQGIVQLLDPPFDLIDLDPGYIKGYVPGVRENGGQYTHAAIWAAMAFAELGDSIRAWELLDMINPIKHSLSAKAIAIYKTEPYVVAADVYAVAPHVGRGGWTWYTGSAGWLYRLIVESLIGLTRQGDRLIIKPCLPENWDTCAITYRFGDTNYHIKIQQPGIPKTGAIFLDGTELEGTEFDGAELEGTELQGAKGQSLVLIDDQQAHQIVVVLPEKTMCQIHQ